MIISITDSFYIAVTYILSALLGLCVGSFLNVVIYRVPLKMSLSSPPSHCPRCDHKIRWYDNIPVVSYIILRGKCRDCGEHISFRYTLVELLNTALWAVCVSLFHENLIYMMLLCIACSVCICVCFIDIEHMVIPDRFQIILAVVAVASIFFDQEYDLLSHLIGFAAALVVFIAVGWGVSSFKKREALGGGDIKFAACAGLLLGWQKFVLMMLIASVGACFVLLARSKKCNVSVEFPFAPYLTAGMVFSMLCGNMLIYWYLTLLSF